MIAHPECGLLVGCDIDCSSKAWAAYTHPQWVAGLDQLSVAASDHAGITVTVVVELLVVVCCAGEFEYSSPVLVAPFQ